MTHKEFADFQEEVFEKIRAMGKTKGVEYADHQWSNTGVDDNRFANFDVISKELEISPFKVWWVYMRKLLFATHRWVRTGSTLSENIEERFLDIVVYTLLAWGMVRRLKAQQDAAQSSQGELDAYQRVYGIKPGQDDVGAAVIDSSVYRNKVEKGD